MTAQALPGAGRPGRATSTAPEVQCLPPQRQTSDLASSTPAKSRFRWQRERLVALRPVLASWTCFSLSDSAGLPVVSSGMNLWGGRGSWVSGGSRNFLRGCATALSSFPSPGSFTSLWLPRATCRLFGPEQGCLGEAVMPGVWEVTLEAGARTLQEMLRRPPGLSPALESGRGPRAALKTTSP